ncbi:unnamed protein product, partial [Ranitomeya imitator]
MKKCRKENPEMPFMFTPRRGVILLLLYYTGLLPFVDLPESVVETYMPSLINRTYFPSHSLMRSRFLTLIMRNSLFQHLQARGIQVYLWVLNQDSEFFRRALDCGVHRFTPSCRNMMGSRGLGVPEAPATSSGGGSQQH